MEIKDRDIEILNSLKGSDRHRATELVFKRFYSDMVDYAWNLVGNKKEAEDAVMEVFVRLLKSTFHFESVNNLRAYLMVSVRNTCFTILSKEDKRVQKQMEAAQEGTSSPDVFETLDFDLMDARILKAIFSEIDNLPNKARIVFLLRTLDASSFEEIAAKMNTTVKTVRNQYHIAVAKLRTSPLKKDLVFTSFFLILSIFFYLFF